MAKCDACGASILFGGVRDGDHRFCNAECHTRGFLLSAAGRVPDDAVAEFVRKIHEGDCPNCGGPGPVDVHSAHTVWSLLVLTSWKSTPRLSCRPCGNRARIGGLLSSGLLGWWGFPWGVIMTPIMIARNVGGLISGGPDPLRPSDQLARMARLQLATQVAQAPPDTWGSA